MDTQSIDASDKHPAVVLEEFTDTQSMSTLSRENLVIPEYADGSASTRQ
jgi:hypothetical protein